MVVGSVPLHGYDAGLNFIASVALLEDGKIEPHTECIPGEIMDTNFECGQEVIVEPLPNSSTTGTLLTALVLAKAYPQATPLLLSNLGSTPVRLKGMLIASISTIPQGRKFVLDLPTGRLAPSRNCSKNILGKRLVGRGRLSQQ